MGLDMYVESIDAKIETQRELEAMYQNQEEHYNQFDEIDYFRKHHDLHRHFRKIWINRTGSKADFNCIPLLLSKDDVVNVIKLAEAELKSANDFSKTEDPIYSSSNEYHWEKTLKVFKSILDSFDFENCTLFYNSWW